MADILTIIAAVEWMALGLLVHLVLKVLDALLHLLGLGQVVPEAVGGRLGLEHVQLSGSPVQIQGGSQLLQGGGQVVQLDFVLVKLEHRGLTLSDKLPKNSGNGLSLAHLLYMRGPKK